MNFNESESSSRLVPLRIKVVLEKEDLWSTKLLTKNWILGRTGEKEKSELC